MLSVRDLFKTERRSLVRLDVTIGQHVVRTCSRYVSRFEYFDKAADSWFNVVLPFSHGRVRRQAST